MKRILFLLVLLPLAWTTYAGEITISLATFEIQCALKDMVLSQQIIGENGFVSCVELGSPQAQGENLPTRTQAVWVCARVYRGKLISKGRRHNLHFVCTTTPRLKLDSA